jgi:CDP-6-deoxy-D-xylo-4-hexulose-3-dehydrase
MDSKLEKILSDISDYLSEKNNNKIWEAGKDWVQYAGPYFSNEEYLSSIETLLNGWLVLGDKGISFENQFPKILNKEYGILTNSGSSSNLIMMSAMASKRLYNLPKGTKVITPIAGFPTTINPIFQVGFVPAFVDIDLSTTDLATNRLGFKVKDGIPFVH